MVVGFMWSTIRLPARCRADLHKSGLKTV